MFKKIMLSVLALFAGPITILMTFVFYDWSLWGAICTAGVLSILAVIEVWK